MLVRDLSTIVQDSNIIVSCQSRSQHLPTAFPLSHSLSLLLHSSLQHVGARPLHHCPGHRHHCLRGHDYTISLPPLPLTPIISFHPLTPIPIPLHSSPPCSMLVRDLSTIVQDSDIIVSEHFSTLSHCFPSHSFPVLPLPPPCVSHCSMLVRDLSTIVQDSDIIVSEHMTTLLVVVAKYSERDWLASYETLSTFVVPQSSKKITEDNEYALFTVTLFKRVVDTFKVAAREKGFQVREYEHDPDGANQRKEDQERLLEDSASMSASLLQWCHVGYGEVFASWMHIAVIRLFAESILRYGLPPAFLPALMTPSQRSEKRLRSILETLSNTDNSEHWRSTDSDASLAGLTGGDHDLHPYVSITMSVAL
ncbi:unnamed protein product, partial [Closterium sp. NIES-53]